jgi:hypothetical protein
VATTQSGSNKSRRLDVVSTLSLRDRELLTEFIENREFGVALEWLHSSIVGNDLRPSGQQLERQRLAERMDIDLS